MTKISRKIADLRKSLHLGDPLQPARLHRIIGAYKRRILVKRPDQSCHLGAQHPVLTAIFQHMERLG